MALNYVLNHWGWELVHGTVRAGRPPIVIVHAWAEKGGVVWDGQLGRAQFWTKEDWYRYVVNVDARYTVIQAEKRWRMSAGSAGPWHR